MPGSIPSTVMHGRDAEAGAPPDRGRPERAEVRCDARSPDVTVVVPTYREADNLPFLLPRVFAALDDADLSGEVVVVDDDSRDGTAEVCAEAAARLPVRLMVRRGERGLSGAVVEGFGLARGEIVAVMDADLSHSPDDLPRLVTAVRRPGTDFAIGSRYVAGGSTEASWGEFRRWNSRVATWIARPLTNVSDPMAGFFAVRRELVLRHLSDLNPVGYKIALELIVKCRCRGVAEVPIEFGNRLNGTSKLTAVEQFNYLRHVLRLLRFKYSRVRGSRAGQVTCRAGGGGLGGFEGHPR